MNRILLILFFWLPSIGVLAEDIWTTVQPSYRQITIVGYSRARHKMVLSTEVSGKVKQVFIDVGDIVPKDEKVACLDQAFVRIDINSAKNDVEQYQIDINYYKKQVNRYQDLVGKKSVAISQLDDFQRQLGNAERLKQSKILEKQRLEEKQKRHCIKSPSGWKVIERHAEPGQWLDVGNLVMEVGNYKKLLVPLALSVNELKAIKNNQDTIKVWLPEYNRYIPATIERISPAFDDSSRKIQVDLLLEKELPVYQGGLRVEVKIHLPDPAGTFFISEKALDKRFEEVWLKPKNGQPIRVKLLGNAGNGKVRISSPSINNNSQFKIFNP